MATGISYSPLLISEFEGDHRKLLRQYGILLNTAKQEDFAAFKAHLTEFKAMLVSHLLKETVKLYIYMRQKLKDDPHSYALVTGYKKEMDGIGKVAMNFVDTYMAQTADRVDFAQLVAELQHIGSVLGDRIRREEAELYPLYHDAY